MTYTCAIDVAMDGWRTLEEVAAIMGGITRERVRQIENKSQVKFRISLVQTALTRQDAIDILRELDDLKSGRDDTIWSEPGLDGRIGRKSFGKMVSDAQRRLVPPHARRYYVGV